MNFMVDCDRLKFIFRVGFVTGLQHSQNELTRLLHFCQFLVNFSWMSGTTDSAIGELQCAIGVVGGPVPALNPSIAKIPAVSC